MIGGLLGLVLWNGVKVFWAPPVPEARLKDGRVLIGQLAQRRVKPSSPAGAPRYERQYQVGLRELNGQSFVWVDESEVAAETFPAGLVGLERMENGPAFVRPVALVRVDGSRVGASDAAFFPALLEEVARAESVRRRHAALVRDGIGSVNADMESARIDLRRAEDRGGDVAAVRARIAALEKKYADLRVRAEAVLAEAGRGALESQDGAGRPWSPRP